jgi:hypothetical protein
MLKPNSSIPFSTQSFNQPPIQSHIEPSIQPFNKSSNTLQPSIQSVQFASQSSTIQPSTEIPTQPLKEAPVMTEIINRMSDNRICKKKYSLNEQYHSLTLSNQLIQLEKYWTQPNNLLRKEAMVNDVTHNKRKERILCFMGWCVEFQALQPDLTLFDVSKGSENRERYEKYLDYLKNDRKLNAGTMVEHFTSAIYALKMLYARYTLFILFFFFYFF